LYYFNAINPKDGKKWSIIHLVQYDEVVDRKSRNLGPSALRHAENVYHGQIQRSNTSEGFGHGLEAISLTWYSFTFPYLVPEFRQ
jgi:hypothetical protein